MEGRPAVAWTALAIAVVATGVAGADPAVTPGWPVSAGDWVQGSVTLGDLDDDGQLDAVAVLRSGVTAFRADGRLLPGWPVSLLGCGAGFDVAAAIADVDGDGRDDVVVSAIGPIFQGWQGSLMVFDRAGNLLPGWPYVTGVRYDDFQTAPTVADLDRDGAMEVVVVSGGEPGLHVVRRDGTAAPGWPRALGGGLAATAAGDIDGDGDLEIVAHVDGSLVALHHDGTSVAGWPVALPSTGDAFSSPVLADLDADGGLDVICGTFGNPSLVLALHGDGTPLRGWPFSLPLFQIVESAPAVGDLDGDGRLDVVVASLDPSRIFALHDDGTLLAGFPVTVTGSFKGSALADVDGDAIPEILVASSTQPWGLHAFHGDGIPVQGFPILHSCVTDFVPTAGDLDGDDDVEILVACTDLLYSYDTPGVAGATPWASFQHDRWHTGRFAFAPPATIAAGQGHGVANPNEVRLFTATGAPSTVDFFAYAAGKYGVNVSIGDTDGLLDEVLTGPGPGATYGPTVRGFRSSGAPVPRIQLYAYGTLRYGVNVAAEDADGDRFAEALTGAGPGDVFGPHVRGFDVEAVPIRPVPGLSFWAYSTLRYGVEVAGDDLLRDGSADILTGPGPGVVFGPVVRGFGYASGRVDRLPGLALLTFATSTHGVHVAAGPVAPASPVHVAAIVGLRGPGPLLAADLAGFTWDGARIEPLADYQATPFATLYGARAATGDVTSDALHELLASPGPDPAALAEIRALAYDGVSAPMTLPWTLLPFPTSHGATAGAGALGW